MFILRTVFWIGLVLLLLPVGRTEHKVADNTAPAQAESVTTGDAIAAAYSTVNDLSGFCDRNAQACAFGSAALSAVEAQAKAGVRAIYDWATHDEQPPKADTADRRSAREGGARVSTLADDVSITGSVRTAGAKPVSRNTLRLEDVIPEWSGPGSSDRA